MSREGEGCPCHLGRRYAPAPPAPADRPARGSRDRADLAPSKCEGSPRSPGLRAENLAAEVLCTEKRVSVSRRFHRAERVAIGGDKPEVPPAPQPAPPRGLVRNHTAEELGSTGSGTSNVAPLNAGRCRRMNRGFPNPSFPSAPS